MYHYEVYDDCIQIQLLKYSPELNELCKNAPTRKYLGDGKWEFPATAENLEYLKTWLPSPELDKVQECYDIVQTSYVWAKVVNPAVKEQLKKELGYYKVFWERDSWGRMIKHKEWVSCITYTGYFFAGLIPEIGSKWKLKIKKLNYKPKIREPQLNGISLRPYQKRAVQSALTKQRGIIHSPTGSGKTVIAAGIISSLQNPKVLFLVHTKALLNQTKKTFRKLLPELSIGMIGGGKETIGDITIAMVQTLAKWEKNKLRQLGKQLKLIIVDEAHHSHADSYRKVLAHLEVPLRIGLTATPHKLWTKEEYMKATGILGPIIESISYKELAKYGFVALPQVIIVYCKADVSGSWYTVYRDGIVCNKERNLVIATMARKLAQQGTVLIQVAQVEHGEIIKSMLSEAYLVTGKTSDELQTKIKESLQNKEIRIVIATTVWKEGVDVPSLDAVINAAGKKSEISTIQAVGRALRPSGSTPVVVDFYDYSNNILEDHSDQRLAVYQAFEWPIKTIDAKEVIQNEQAS